MYHTDFSLAYDGGLPYWTTTCTVTENLENSEETCPHKEGISRADFDPAHRELEEDLEDIRWQANKVSVGGVRRRLGNERTRRRSDDHTARNDGTFGHTFCVRY